MPYIHPRLDSQICRGSSDCRWFSVISHAFSIQITYAASSLTISYFLTLTFSSSSTSPCYLVHCTDDFSAISHALSIQITYAASSLTISHFLTLTLLFQFCFPLLSGSLYMNRRNVRGSRGWSGPKVLTTFYSHHNLFHRIESISILKKLYQVNKVGHYRPASETSLLWHLASRLMVAWHCMLAG